MTRQIPVDLLARCANSTVHLEDALSLLRPGGIYVGDDLLPQPSWPDGHAPKIPQFLNALEQRPDLHITRLTWSTGLVLATKRSNTSTHHEAKRSLV